MADSKLLGPALVALILVVVGSALYARSCVFNAGNYSDPRRPRYADAFAPARNATAPVEFKLTTLNYQFAYEEKRRAVIDLLRADPRFSGSDAYALQEMDSGSVRAIAEELHLNYVYYPARIHPTTNREFGNAVLTPWPIKDDWKLLLPHLRPTNEQRIAVAAKLAVGPRSVRVYSVHLATIQSTRHRIDQASVVLSDSFAHCPSYVLVAGDFNTLLDRKPVAKPFQAAGFLWITEDGKPTTRGFLKGGYDQIFAFGFTPLASATVGSDVEVSDHFPISGRFRFADDEATCPKPPAEAAS